MPNASRGPWTIVFKRLLYENSGQATDREKTRMIFIERIKHKHRNRTEDKDKFFLQDKTRAEARSSSRRLTPPTLHLQLVHRSERWSFGYGQASPSVLLPSVRYVRNSILSPSSLLRSTFSRSSAKSESGKNAVRSEFTAWVC